MKPGTVLLFVVLAGCVLLAASLAGCPKSPAGTPASPTAVEPRVAVTASPTPLVATREPAGAPARYRVTADLSFKELAGQPVRITGLKVDVVASSGWTAASSQDADLSLAAYGAANLTLTTMIDAAGPADSGRWRLTAVAARSDGQPVLVAPVESELRFSAVPPAVPDEIFVGAGDLTQCGGGQSGATAALLDGIPGTVFTLGDNVYPTATAGNFAQCYEPTWGRHRARTFPTVGNHDWQEASGAAYFAYFGASAGPAGLGYYSYDLGAWHVISLNSQVAAGPGSRQYEWLKADLAASAAPCTVALWHHPVFSSGPHGNQPQMREAWRLLNQYGADVVLNGHEHVYERFAPQDADGKAAPTGIREFIVGTGGYSLYDRVTFQPNSEAWENRTWGVLKLILKSGSYDWQFLPIAGQSFHDSGSAKCVSPSTP